MTAYLQQTSLRSMRTIPGYSPVTIQIPVEKYVELKGQAVREQTTVPQLLEKMLGYISPRRNASERGLWKSHPRVLSDLEYGIKLRRFLERSGGAVTLRVACQLLAKRVVDIERYCAAAKLYIVDRGDGHHRRWVQMVVQLPCIQNENERTLNGYANSAVPALAAPPARLWQDNPPGYVPGQPPSKEWMECEREATAEIVNEELAKMKVAKPEAPSRCEICGEPGTLDNNRVLCKECRADVVGRSQDA